MDIVVVESAMEEYNGFQDQSWMGDPSKCHMTKELGQEKLQITAS